MTRNDRGWIFVRKRNDARNLIEYQAGAYLGDKTFIRSTNKYFYNDSNEMFEDYYDYWSFKTDASLIQLITDKLYAAINFAYMRTWYRERSILQGQEKQTTPAHIQ